MRLALHVHNLARHLDRLVWGALLAWACASSAQAAPNGEIQDPHYGDTLFQYFQDHYFTAATTLMVSQHFGRVSQHSEEAEVLRGGILLSYGLHREAGDIFERLIAMGATPPTRDRAWFYLAKIRYQRGYLPEAENALARIGMSLAPELQEERGLLQAQLQMARGDYAAAATVLAALEKTAPDPRYVRYNLGVALIKSGDAAKGNALLNAVGVAYAENEEFRSMRDRANVALGFAALADQQAPAARNYLERVRLKSIQANKALLGLGWAATSQKEFARALTPWLELAGRDLDDTAVLEAYIAIPYAYAELGAYSESAERYQQAIATFECEDKALNESIAEIRAGKLQAALVSSNPGEEMGWFWSVRDLPVMPHARHLSHVLAQHEFQEALKNYRDLQFLTGNLQTWRDKLGTFDDMLATRRKAFAEKLPDVQSSANSLQTEPLRARHAALALQVQQAETAADGVAFADARQAGLLQRISGVKSALQNPPADIDLASAQQRVRLAEGVLTWELAQAYPQRSWETQRDLQATQDALDQAQKLDATLKQAQWDAPVRFDAFGARIKAISPVLQTEIARVDKLTQEQALALQDIAITALRQQQEQLAQYTTQARFAVAQLYDRGTAQRQDASATGEANRAR
jgi:hypothetical protein